MTNRPIDAQSATKGREARRKSAGFTLLEVVVSVALLGLILATALELLGIGLQSAKTSGDYTQATVLAKRMLSDLTFHPLAPEVLDGSSGGYRWTTEIAPESEGAEVSLYRLRVRVSWPGKRGQKGVELVTLRALAPQETLSATTPDAQRPSNAPASPMKRGRNR